MRKLKTRNEERFKLTFDAMQDKCFAFSSLDKSNIHDILAEI